MPESYVCFSFGAVPAEGLVSGLSPLSSFSGI